MMRLGLGLSWQLRVKILKINMSKNLQNYSLHSGNYSEKGLTVESEFMRGHIFPVGSLQGILKSKYGKKLSELKVEGMPKSQILSVRGKSPLYDLVPFLVIPEILEHTINKAVREYAKQATKKQDGTGGDYEEGSAKNHFIIINESDFAEKYPSVYLEIFRFFIKKHAEELQFRKETSFAESLEKAFEAGLVDLEKAKKSLSLDKSFCVDESKLPRSHSDVENDAIDGKKNLRVRKIKEPFTKPSIKNFEDFFNAHLKKELEDYKKTEEAFFDKMAKKTPSTTIANTDFNKELSKKAQRKSKGGCREI